MTAIDRRTFARLAALAPLVPKHFAQSTPTTPARMKVGTQHGDSDAILRAMAGFGVNHICSRLPSARLDDQWAVDGLSRLRARVESYGITLDVVLLPMSSNQISRFEWRNLMLGRIPQRYLDIYY